LQIILVFQDFSIGKNRENQYYLQNAYGRKLLPELYKKNFYHEKSESGSKSKIHKNNGRNPGVFLPPLFLPLLLDFL